jgi:hypothetical protein
MDKSRQEPVKNDGAKHNVFLHKYQVLIPLVILALSIVFGTTHYLDKRSIYADLQEKWVELEKVELALQQLQLRRGELEKFPPH